MPPARVLLLQNKAASSQLADSLKALGYDVVGKFTSSAKARASIPDLCPDLLLISIHLTKVGDGLQAGEALYREYQIPVIYLSDEPFAQDREEPGFSSVFGTLSGQADKAQVRATIDIALTRKRIETDLRESVSRLNAIMGCISDGLIAADRDERIFFINPAAEALLGREAPELLNRSVSDVLTMKYLNTDKKVSLPHVLAAYQDMHYGLDAELQRPDGNVIPVEVFTTPLSENGIHIGMALTIRDFSDRKQSLEEIQSHATRSDAMVKAARQLNARLNVKAVLNTVCEICNNTLKTTATSSFLHDHSRSVLVSAAIAAHDAGSGYPFQVRKFPGRFEIPLELVESAMSPSSPVITIRDIHTLEIPELPYLEEIRASDIQALAIAGMYQQDELIGILVAQMHGQERDFTHEELGLLSGLADQASIAVGNALLFEQVVASRERQQLLARRLVDLQEDERRNLSRELHDHIGQLMTGLQFSLSSLLPQASESQKARIAEAQEQVRNIISQTREIALNLRPSLLDDIGLIMTLIWHFDRFTSQTGIKVNFHHSNLVEKRLDTTIETAVFRIIQEALTNVARHTKTEAVHILLTLEDQQVKLTVTDEGQGFDLRRVDQSEHMGLNSMRERAYAVGGLLDIDSNPARGTCIRAVLPLEGNLERRQHERQSSSR